MIAVPICASRPDFKGLTKPSAKHPERPPLPRICPQIPAEESGERDETQSDFRPFGVQA